jgi:hypothetical protein
LIAIAQGQIDLFLSQKNGLEHDLPYIGELLALNLSQGQDNKYSAFMHLLEG